MYTNNKNFFASPAMVVSFKVVTVRKIRKMLRIATSEMNCNASIVFLEPIRVASIDQAHLRKYHTNVAGSTVMTFVALPPWIKFCKASSGK